MHHPSRDEILPGVALPGLDAARPLDTALDLLDRFGQALQKCSHTGQQIHLILESIRASLRCDVVFWEPGTTADTIEVYGKTTLPPVWFRNFALRLVAEESGWPASILRSNLLPTCPADASSAALVRISKTHGSWLGAVNFGPRKSLVDGDVKVMLLARRMLLSHRQQNQALDRLRDSLFGLVRCLAAAIDARDSYTFGHSERVARIAVRIGQEMKLSQDALSDVFLGGLLHDIGKIGIRDSVLLKPGKLTDDEHRHMQQHTVIGDRLVGNVAALDHLRVGIRHHHENFDGTGYPDGLSGEAIPFVARLLAVADACDAMMANRPYRTALTPHRIDGIMTKGAGTQWDPTIIKYFLACRHDLYAICQRGLGDSVIAAVDHVVDRVSPVEESVTDATAD